MDWLIRYGITLEGELAISLPLPLSPAASNRPRTRTIAFLEKWSKTQAALTEVEAEQAAARANGTVAVAERKLRQLRG